MFIFNYHPETKEFVGVSQADPNPLEPGGWLVPAHATSIQPPAPIEGKTINFIDDTWVHVDIPVVEEPEPMTLSYADLRRMEYPNVRDYLDGIVKGDQAQIDKYIADCLAVKAKYPKPE